jgi:hypothetical protein
MLNRIEVPGARFQDPEGQKKGLWVRAKILLYF